jgi:N12 class adenine-specific DNA methylase
MAKLKQTSKSFDAIIKQIEEERRRQEELVTADEAKWQEFQEEWAGKGVNPELAHKLPTLASGIAAVNKALASIAPKETSDIAPAQPQVSPLGQPVSAKPPLGYAPRVNIGDPRALPLDVPVEPFVPQSIPGKATTRTVESFMQQMPGGKDIDATGTGARGLDVATSLIGGTASHIAQLLAAQKLATLAAGALVSEQARKAIPPLAATMGTGAAARAIKWGTHKAADPESITGKDLARDVAFGVGATTAGDVTSTALRHAFPGIHPLIEAPVTGAAAGTAGAVAGYPFSDKKGMDYLKEMGNTILAQTILQTVWTAGSPSTWQPKQNFGRSMATARKHYDDIFEAFEGNSERAANIAYREFQKNMDNALHYAHQAGATPDPAAWRAKAEDVILQGFKMRGWTPHAEAPTPEPTTGPAGIPAPKPELTAPVEPQAPAPPVVEPTVPAVQPVVPTPTVEPTPAVTPEPKPETIVPLKPTADFKPTHIETTREGDVPVKATFYPDADAWIVERENGASSQWPTDYFERFHKPLVESEPTTTSKGAIAEPKKEAPIEESSPEPVHEPELISEPPERVPGVTPELVGQFKEMFGDKYDTWRLRKEEALKVIKPFAVAGNTPEDYEETIMDIHKRVIKAALVEGLPVPQEVIDDYPDVKRFYENMSPPGEFEDFVASIHGKAEAPKATTEVAAEPWQMTLDEFSQAVMKGEIDFPAPYQGQLSGAEHAKFLASAKETGYNLDIAQQAFDKAVEGAHQIAVVTAYMDGKPVPQEIIAPYLKDAAKPIQQPIEAVPEAQPVTKPAEYMPKDGDRVTWTSKNGERLTGVVSSIDEQYASVKVDQVAAPGGVPVLRTEVLPASRLEPLATEGAAGATAQPTATETTIQPETPEPKISTPKHGATVTENEEKDGVEIRFREKPDKDIIAQLHSMRFRWSPRQKLWYAKRTPERLEFAYGLAGQSVPTAQAEDVGIIEAEKPEPPITEQAIEPPSATTEPSDTIEPEVQTDVQDIGQAVPASPVEMGIQGPEALEGTPSEDVQGAGAERHPVQDGVQRTGENKGRNDRLDESRPELGQGVGTGEGGMDRTPDGGRRTPAGRGEEGGATRPTADGGRRRDRDRDRVVVAANYRITDADNLGAGGEKIKARANIEAIQTLKQIEAEGRPATSEEQAVLVKYVGWGGLSNVFKGEGKWVEEYNTLKELLTPEEFRSAQATVLNAHYTSQPVIEAMWKAARHFGFTGGRVLEPAAGIGHFVGLMPDDVRGSRVTCIELDDITGRIARALYPNADVRIQGFEDAKLIDDFYDIVISNVPFGDYQLAEEDYNKYKFYIHDHFIAKSIDKVRPGGIVMVITSSGTMNSERSAKLRAYANSKADFVGAIRLPSDAFKANAGTEVTTDIIVLRKRLPGEKPSGEAWMKTVPTGMKGKFGDILKNNEYYVEHPEMMLGKLAEDKLYPGRIALNPDGRDLGEALSEAFKHLPQDIMTKLKHPPTEEFEPRDMIPAPGTVKEGAFVIQGGKVYVKEGNVLEPRSYGPKVTGRIKGMVALRDAALGHIHLQLEGASDAAIKNSEKVLNRIYDKFVKKHGYLHDNPNQRAFSDDPDFHFVMSLERDYTPAKDGKPASAEKAAIFSKRTMPKQEEITSVDTIEEALTVTLNQRGCVDIPHMARLSEKSEDEIKSSLGGTVLFNDPSAGWVTKDEYLSGNVRKKLREAKIAAKTDPSFKANVEALKKVQPPKLEFESITMKLGSTWMPPDVMEDFLVHLFGEPYIYEDDYTVKFIPQTGDWVINAPRRLKRDVAATRKWGTKRLSGIDLISRFIVYGRSPVVYDTLEDGTRVRNATQTIAAQEKCKAIEEEFQKWLLENRETRDRLVDIWNDKLRALRLRNWDGSHLTFPGQNTGVLHNGTFYPHQKNAVWRILQGGNCLLAHPVGSGKTWEMAAGIMELRRLGICQKILLVVPNHRVQGTAEEFLTLYPAANILVADAKRMTKKNRNKFMSQVATGDYDAIIMAHSSFGKISMSEEFITSFFEEQINELEEALIAEKEQGRLVDKGFVKRLERAKKSLETNMKRTIQALKQDKGAITFEEAGIDGIFLDESHEYKNLAYYTKLDRVKGLGSPEGNNKTFDLLMKIRYLQKLNGGRGIVFATGTPISNSMVEMYALQRYLQPDELEAAGIYNFDSWQRAFGDITPTIELDATGSQFRTYDRLSQFVNAGDLLTMFRSFADVVSPEELNLPIPALRGDKREGLKCDKVEGLQEYIDSLVERMGAVRSGSVSPEDDNALKIMGDARKAALDLSLIMPNAIDDPRSKLNSSAQNIARIHDDTKKDKLTQLVFIDLGVPSNAELKAIKDGTFSELDPKELSIYGKLKCKLMELGVPEDEIAFIHEANTDTEKQELFNKVNHGDIRILIGSTAKMGQGTNVQKRLVALHHLDVPWRPSDVEQREGRILRQGNRNKEVQIYAYVTEGSFDAAMWRVCEIKSSFMQQALSGDLSIRVMPDTSDVVLSYAEMSAIASENPDIMRHYELTSRINELTRLKNHYLQTKTETRQSIEYNRDRVKMLEDDIENIAKDLRRRTDTKGDKFRIVIGKKTYTKRTDAGPALEKALGAVHGLDPVVVGEFAGFTITGKRSIDKRDVMLAAHGAYTHKCATPTLGSLEATIRNMDDKHKDISQYIAKLKKQTVELEAEYQKPFAHEEELAQITEERDSIALSLKADAPPTGGADVDDLAMDADIDDYDIDTDIGDTVRGYPDNKKKTPAPRSTTSDTIKAEKTAAPSKPVGKQDIINYLSENLMVPIRTGRVGSRKALGEYKTRQQVARLKKANDLPTAFHEAGHHIEGLMGLSARDLGKFAKELTPLSEELYPNETLGVKLSEGFAEFFREYMMDSDKAKELAPLFYDHFEGSLDKDLKATIDTAKEMYRKYHLQGAADRVGAMIVDTPPETDSFLTKKDKKRTEWVNALHPLYKAMKEMYPEEIKSEWDVPLEYNPYVLRVLAEGSTRSAVAMLVNGMVSPDLEVIGPSYLDILKPVADRFEEFTRYITALHAIEIEDRGMESGFDRADCEATIELYDCPEFRLAAEQREAFMDNLLDWLVDSGRLSQKSVDAMRRVYQHHVSFYRVFEEGGPDGPRRKGKSMVDLPSPIKRQYGSTRPIYNPIHNDIINTFYFIDIAKRSYAAQALASLADKAEGKGWLVERVPMPKEVSKVELKRLRRDLIEAGIPKEDLDDADLERIALVFNPRRFAGFKEKQDNIFVVHRGDRACFYKAHPDLYRTLQATNTEASNWLIKLLGAISEPLHVGAVATLSFGGRNIVKDTGTKVLYSDSDVQNLVGDFTKGFAHALKKDDIWTEFHAAGGGQASRVSLNRAELTKNVMKHFDEDEKVTTKVIDAFTSPYRAIKALLEMTEDASRIGEYVHKRGDNPTREDKLWAGYAGREVTVDFSIAGTKGRQWNLVVRFFNPGLQGIDKFIREFNRDPGKMLVRGSLISLISLLTYLVNRNNPRYQDENRYRKDRCWCYYPTENIQVYLPKPFEPGIVFGSSVERFLEYIDTHDPEAMEELARSILDELSPDVIPTAMAGLIELMSNKSLLTGAPIVPPAEQRLEPRDQYGPMTTAPAITLGQLLNVSPRRIEAMISAYTGGLGLEVLDFLDILAGGATSKRHPAQLTPGVKGFVGRPYVGSRSINRLYEEKEKLEKQKASFDKAVKQGKRPRNVPDMARLSQLRATANFLTQMRKERDRVLESPRYAPDEKRRMVDSINKRMAERAKQTMDIDKKLRVR